MISTRRALIASSVCALWIAFAAHSVSQPVLPDYEDVRPIFEDNCIMCHSGPKAPKGLGLDNYENIINGSENGPVVKPKNPSGSELIQRVRGISRPRMPLSGPPWLAESEVRLIEEWIKHGALAIRTTSANTSSLIPQSEEAALRKGVVTFKDVGPILKANCVKCHNYNGLMGSPPEGFVLASYREVMNGTEQAYVIPGSPNASELVRKIRGQSFPRMPFDGPPYLTADQVALIEQWVEQGARDDSGHKAEIPVGRKVRLRGKLSAAWVLDGLPMNVGTRTEIKRKTSVGDYVEVRGWVTSKGGINAERIRVRKQQIDRAGDDD